MSEIRGFRWPMKFVGGKVATSSGVQHLKENMAQIIMCSKGDYLMRPEFGSGLPERVFDQVSLLALVWTDVADALRIWERRVQLVDVQAGPVESAGTFQLGAATTEAIQSGIVGIHIRFRERGADETVDLNLSTQLR